MSRACHFMLMAGCVAISAWAIVAMIRSVDTTYGDRCRAAGGELILLNQNTVCAKVQVIRLKPKEAA